MRMVILVMVQARNIWHTEFSNLKIIYKGITFRGVGGGVEKPHWGPVAILRPEGWGQKHKLGAESRVEKPSDRVCEYPVKGCSQYLETSREAEQGLEGGSREETYVELIHFITTAETSTTM